MPGLHTRGVVHRKGGRPRNPALDGKIVAAALELLPKKGIDGTSMDDVALLAGVSKPTIYRRWPSKDDLMIEAIALLAKPIEGVDDPDPKVALARVIEDVTNRVNRYIDPPMPDPRLRAVFKEKVLGKERAQVAAVFERAMASGAARSDIDVETAVDFVYGIAFYFRSQDRLDELGDRSIAMRAAEAVELLWSGLAR